MLLLMSQLFFPNKNNLLSESTMQIIQGDKTAYQTQHEKATHKKLTKTVHRPWGNERTSQAWNLVPLFSIQDDDTRP